DRDARLHFVDDVAAGGEGGIAVRGGDADPDGQFADRQLAGAVHAVGVEDVERRQGFGQDRLAFTLRQRRIGLVAQAVDVAVVVVVAHPALETGVGANARVEQLRTQGGGVERG